MYRKIFQELSTSSEDRNFILTLLTTDSIREEIREDKYIEEFFDKALNLFPEDRDLILQFGRYENSIGNYDRAQSTLDWGRSIYPRDRYLLHQLGLCAQRRSMKEEDQLIKDALKQEALSLFRNVQEIDPTSRYGYISEISLLLNQARNEADNERKLTLLSEVEDTIRRGMNLVREDDIGFLEGYKAELISIAGKPEEVIKQIKEIEIHNSIRYGAIYHLWAVCLSKLDKVEEALSVIEKGIKLFPGDTRLIYLTLDLLEDLIYDPKSRELAITVIEKYKEIDKANIRVLFVKGVVHIYNTQYTIAKSIFREIRQQLGFRASTRIRVVWSDPDGNAMKRTGVFSHKKYGKYWIKDIETGMRLPMDNHVQWEKLGSPNSVTFNVGFSFPGPRAIILNTT